MKIHFFLFTLFIALSAQGSVFSFDHGNEEWGMWGEGAGAHSANAGHNKKGSIWLSTDYGETHTAHYHWNNLRPGLYNVSFYIKAKNVQKGSENTSFWHFYDGGFGEKTVFHDLSGNYGWRKVEYTLNVKDKNLSIWFRLKSPGQVWFDDFKIEKTNVTISHTLISPETPYIDEVVSKKIEERKSQEKMILDFDKVNPSTSLQIASQSSTNKMGRFSSREYINFNVDEINKGNWNSFDRIELDIFSSHHEFLDFYLTLGDEQAVNYWSQLNHKGHLAPGWNHLSFSLDQYVGERGSHRFFRSLNLKSLKKFFIVVDPDGKHPLQRNNLFIDNIKLKTNPYPAIPKSVIAFDFTSQKDPTESGFQKISSQSLYSSSQKAGFIDPKFWRVEDSQYASSTLRYSIGILDGTFRVSLPNGKYKVQLLIDKLGYWDPPFWKHRSVFLNQKPFIMEMRSSAGDYLKDYFRFENIVPTEHDHPFDLYLTQLFKPYEKEILVSNGHLDIDFEADASGISLNRLLIWKSSEEKTAREYLKKLSIRDRLEFDWMARPIQKKKVASQNIKKVSVVDPDLFLSPSDARAESSKKLQFTGSSGEKPFQLLQILSNGESSIKWKMSDLKNAQGKLIKGNHFKFSDVVYQYVSPDLNHETYMVVGKYLKTVQGNELLSSYPGTKFLWLELPVTKLFSPGKYEGSLSLQVDAQNYKIPVSLKILPYTLPQIDFPVGFFGLDPIPHNWFDSSDMKLARKKYRSEAIKLLGGAGFTTFSGLPEVPVISNGTSLSIDTSELDELFDEAKEYGMGGTVFSYGGKFPQTILDESQKPYQINSNEYHANVSNILKASLESPTWPSIIHTFSDEAAGYSDKVNEDIQTAKWLKEKYSFLRIGGFSSMKGSDVKKLNELFDYGFYSKFEKSEAAKLEEKGKKWGTYNGAPGNLNDPRFAFGPGLYVGRSNGLSHYLEWHAVGFNNYPYYDLDGRESDVSMFLPGTDGTLHPAIRFEFAAQGLHAYQKMTLLNQLILSGKGNKKYFPKASNWLRKNFSKEYFSDEEYLKGKNFDFKKFENELNQLLTNLAE